MPAVHRTIVLEGLSRGGGGVQVIERVLEGMPGVHWVYTNPATEMAYIECDSTITEVQLATTLEEAGLRAGEIRVR